MTTMQQDNSTPEGTRRLWNNAEDELLVKAVEKHGPKEWDKIAAEVGSRKDWQCRERWHNHLKPGVCKKPWEAWEDELLEAQVQKNGTSWASIAQSFPGRPTTSVKNRWHQLQRQHRRHPRAGSVSSTPVTTPFTSPLTARQTYDSPIDTTHAMPSSPAMFWPNLNLALQALSTTQLAGAQPQLPSIERAALQQQQQQLAASETPVMPDASALLASYSAMLAGALPPLAADPSPLSSFLLHANPEDHNDASAQTHAPGGKAAAVAGEGDTAAPLFAVDVAADPSFLDMVDDAYLLQVEQELGLGAGGLAGLVPHSLR